ncbi:MAG: hypothetical protein HKN09_08425, partial [Saprospiraceae bacterium]|nr:hypothetical protein [Saprospiraceae bacterium]
SIDSLNAEVKLVIEKNDYLPDYNEKLKSYQQKAHMKGFRKGKTPMGMIKKMYGSQTMQESISKILSEKINEIITGDEFNIIGEPLLKNQESLPEIDHNDPQDYTYEFELGLEPEFDISGVAESDSYVKHVIDIDDKIIDEEVENITKRMGTQEATDQVIEAEDVIKFEAHELDGKLEKKDGHEAVFTVPFDKLNEKYQKALKGKKVGDSLTFDIFDLEQGVTEDYVKKHLLKLDDEASTDEINKEFKGDIAEVIRVKPAVFNQELFDKYFGPEVVKGEEEARTKIKEYIGEYFANESVNLLNREIMQALMDKNSFDLPDGFLRKWMTQEKDINDEQFDAFKTELKWRIIKKKLVKQFEIEVKEDEIFQFFVNAVRNYSPYIDEASLKNTVFSLMQNREQLNSAVENISSGKLFDAIREVIKVDEKSIDKDGFYKIVESLNQKVQ